MYFNSLWKKWLITALAGLGSITALMMVFFAVALLIKQPQSPSYFLASLLFALPGERVVVNVDPASVISGSKINVVWRHENKRGDGEYTLRYLCSQNIELKLESGQTVPCDQSFPIDAGGLVPLFALSQNASSTIQGQIFIDFTSDGHQQAAATGSAVVAVTPTGKTGAVEESPSMAEAAGTPKPLSAGTPSIKVYPVGQAGRIAPNGVPDLKVDVIDVGIINPVDGQFSHATSTSKNTEIGVIFDISNAGTAVSNKWRFQAHLPIVYDSDFLSEFQEPLKPGEKVRFTLGFKNPWRNGENSIVLTIDPQNELRDANRGNDSATAKIAVE